MGAAFRKGLEASAYVDGQTVAIEYRWADGRSERRAYEALPIVWLIADSRKSEFVA